MILKGILIFLILIVCPLVTGDAVAKFTNTEVYTVFDNIVYKYVFGNVVMWAAFEIIAVPLILMKKSFMQVVYIWCAVLAVILLCDIFLIIYRFVRKGNTKRNHGYELKSIVNKNNIFTFIIAIVAVVLIAYQCYVYVAYMHIDDDDSRFVVNACEAYDNDSMLLINPATGEYEGTWVGELAKDVTSPWSIYVAAVSKFVHIYPTIVFHTIIPVFLLLMAYGVYWLLAKKLFKSNTTQAAVLFVLFVALVNMYFNTSAYTGSTFLLTRIWQGKAVVAGVMIPALFYLLYSYYQNAGYGTYIMIALTNIALCLLSGMGIFFGIIMTAVYGVYYAVVNKKWLGIIWILMTCVPSMVFAFLYATVK
jgi:hypothetical protein